MQLENALALSGITMVLLGTILTLYGIFAARAFLTYAVFEAGHRDAPTRVAIVEKYSRPVPPYTPEQVRIAQKEAELKLADRLLDVARLVDDDRESDLRKSQRSAAIGVLLITAGSIAQGLAVLAGN